MKKTIIRVTIDGIENNGKISDGYHTFDELYEHRMTLFVTLCREMQKCREFAMEQGGMVRYVKVWRSKFHNDVTMFKGMFIMGIGKDPGDQITYHLDLKYWDETSFAETLPKAPEHDGHTSDDVLERLKKL